MVALQVRAQRVAAEVALRVAPDDVHVVGVVLRVVVLDRERDPLRAPVVTVAAALAGEGVVRSLDLAIEAPLREGRLVPALTDWDAIDSPQVRLMYRPAAGRLPRVRLAIDFLADLFGDVERRCAALAGARPHASAPAWAGTRSYRRASSAADVDRRRDAR